MYALTDGVPSTQTRIMLVDGLPEPLCMNQNTTGSPEVLLEVCADAPLERWHVTVGASQIVTAEQAEELCITAPENGQRGDFVSAGRG